ncbi:copper resistance protein NlpE N-terminal domain-containing protein [Litchfieldella xinjiangensis]|uniref:copper resistance protein NlpE N-terminal domain-containing protein n=1 Tax=Litchfieldella xinjiangensis TaxID=1166948 RepID=UPI0005B96488|nr:copper resistance protein NlpE N-terminal domain-containing protein [Halomonas xinjiangensis]
MQVRTLLVGSAMLAMLAGCATGPTETAPPMDETAEGEAHYQGTLPCRNCAGIDIDVYLEGTEEGAAEERTFTLDASYREHPQDPPDENYAGQWEVLSGTAADPEATVYELTPDGEGQIYYFLRVDESTLELIDPERRRFQNNEMLQLQRQ